MSKKNALGLIFKVERSLGYGDTIDIVVDFQDGTTVRKQFHHEFCDGLGALLLTSQGWQGAQLKLPSRRIRLDKPLTQIVSGLSSFISDLNPRQTKWRSYNENTPYHADLTARRVFDAETSALIQETARKQGVSVNAFMLWHLNSAVCSQLMSDEQKNCHWVIPINMRRSRGEELRVENRISSVGLHFERGSKIEQLGQLYSKAINPVHAFANELLVEMLALLGEDKLLKRFKNPSSASSWTGIFTNLGQWDFPHLAEGSSWPIAVSITPPGGTPSLPIGGGIMSWRGHLSLTLRLHPALAQGNDNLPDAVLNHALELIDVSIGQQTKLLRA